MKTTTTKTTKTNLFALLAFAIAASANAAVTVTASETPGGVLFAGGGTLNLTALTLAPGISSGSTPFINPGFETGLLRIGATGTNPIDDYSGAITGGGPFGTGGGTLGTAGTGDTFGVSLGFSNNVTLEVPDGYVSGNLLAGTGLFGGAGTTFSSLGLTPGTYTYSFGSGANADSFTIVIPEPSTALLLALGTFSLAVRRRR